MGIGKHVEPPWNKWQKMRKTLCRTVTLTILLWSAALPCAQADSTAGNQQEKAVKPVRQQEEKSKEAPKARHHLRPFTPSERIGADQAVAFPVDI